MFDFFLECLIDNSINIVKMEGKIDNLLKKLRCEYIAFWALTALLACLYENDWLPKGVMTDESLVLYLIQCAGVLLTIVLIPLALRLFGMGMLQRVRQLPLEQALVSYRRWNQVRLALLFVVVMVNLTFYYLTLRTGGALCAVMALMASLCCLPSRRRIWRELDLENLGPEEEQEDVKE